jgi:hypothetical protein
MPDLIRHPEHIEFTGFRLVCHRHGFRRNDGKERFPTFDDSINIEIWNLFVI